jgi:hypothetical protein
VLRCHILHDLRLLVNVQKTDACNEFLQGCRVELSQVRYLNAGASAEDWAYCRSTKALRLTPGNTGYFARTAAPQLFVNAIKPASVCMYGDETDPVHDFSRLEEIESLSLIVKTV